MRWVSSSRHSTAGWSACSSPKPAQLSSEARRGRRCCRGGCGSLAQKLSDGSPRPSTRVTWIGHPRSAMSVDERDAIVAAYDELDAAFDRVLGLSHEALTVSERLALND